MKIYVSRHKMTECPSCGAHIRVAAAIAETACPFCDGVLGQQAAAPRSSMARRAMTALGRGSLVAGALLGMSVMGGCEDDPEPTSDIPVQPAYGLPADIALDTGPDAAADPGPQPLYGAVPADIEVDQAPDAGPQPEYGIPADQ